ncbi:TRAP transporter small permease subunit [Tropicimonas sp. IMCC6043]|uniref:TRAP transporter small permease subunit n=1 Tax=Tropicimonas sp. IMCC6043 TaxID=2510645 RepID=UPI00101E15BE|nr:TRAP transporter small permease subunit [Tropicimonas sp. IMCC6043]RYH09638.1 TRAP transporter small permease subunit [Tropicimonas sp. IMCC6043]
MPKAIRIYMRAMDRISNYVGILAMYLIFLMIAVLLLDAVTRNLINIPLHWCVEFAQFTLAAYYFLGGPVTLKDDEHVRMDLFYASFSRFGKHRMDLATLPFLLFYLVVMMIGSWSSLKYAIETDERRFSMWNPSVIPIKALMLVCIVLMILQTVSLIFKHIEALRTKAFAE